MANELRARIKTLWERLETPEDEREDFFARHTGYKPSIIEAVSGGRLFVNLSFTEQDIGTLTKIYTHTPILAVF